MRGKPNSRKAIPGVKITLDGQAVCLAPEDIRSLAAIRACMEQIASRQRRVLVGLAVEARTVNLGDGEAHCSAFAGSPDGANSLEHLREQSVRGLRVRLRPLNTRVEKLTLLATINDWPIVERLWWELLPELRASILSLSLLEKSSASPLAAPHVGSSALAGHLEQLATILQEVGQCLAREDTLELSDSLERRLLPWLRQLDTLLAQWK